MLPDIRTEIPGPESRRLAGVLQRHESRNVTCISREFPIFWNRAEGANVWDADGNRFLDLTSAFAVTGLGHGAESVRAALVVQSRKLMHAMGDVHPTPEKARLCQVLSEITFERWSTGAGKCFLGCSGSDAVEAALKTALLHTGRRDVIHFSGGYHGLGFGALETAGIPWFRMPFREQLAGFGVEVPYPRTDLADCEKHLREAFANHPVGAILAEPVQGRGGEVVPAPGFLSLLRRICDEHGALLILDEIYTGFHRTGALFACEHENVVPDLICLGKALTSGFPLSACVGRAAIMDAWPESNGEALHTSTFLGNPMGCAMALASIEAHRDPETASQVQTTITALDTALSRLTLTGGELRGIGLMRGIEIVHPDGTPDPGLAGWIVRQGLRDGLILLAGSPGGHVLSITPPFCIATEEIDFAIGRIQEYLTSRAGSIS